MSKSKLFEVEEQVLEEIVKTFDRSVKSLNEDVKVLQQWMGTQKHLPEIMDEKPLQNFLLMNKFSIEKTKEKVDMYYTVRSVLEDVYAKINPKLPNTQKVMEALYFVPLPKLTPEMYRVFAFKVRDKDLVDTLDPYDMMRHAINMLELRLLEDVTFGEVCIMDWGGGSTKFLLKLTPTFIYKIVVTLYEKVYSALKGVYHLNAPPLLEKVLTIAKTIMKPKLFERHRHFKIYICQDTNILFEKFPRSIIPKDFGGEEKSLDEIAKILAEKFVEHEKRFDQLNKLSVNESLRPSKLKNDEILGFHGNFKKLEVD